MRRVSSGEFIQSLGMGEVALAHVDSFVHPVPGDWKTQPRTSDSRFEVHYLFGSPQASLLVKDERGEWLVPKGSFVWFPPHWHYSMEMKGQGGEVLFFRMRFQLMKDGVQLTPHTQARSFKAMGSMVDTSRVIFKEIWHETLERSLRQRAHLILFLTELFHSPTPSAQGPGLGVHEVSRLREWFRPDLRQSPGEAAQMLGMSDLSFSRRFKRTMGRPYRTWQVENRMEVAASLLKDDGRSIQSIASSLGYEEPFLFSRQFRQVMGLTPSHYRRKA